MLDASLNRCSQTESLSPCKHIKRLMSSDNRSLFALTNKLVAGSLLLAFKLQQGKCEIV